MPIRKKRVTNRQRDRDRKTDRQIKWMSLSCDRWFIKVNVID